MGVPTFVLYALAAPTALWIFAYFAPLLYCLARGSQDLKRKYDAKWALVTGGSTGIGRALCEEQSETGCFRSKLRNVCFKISRCLSNASEGSSAVLTVDETKSTSSGSRAL